MNYSSREKTVLVILAQGFEDAEAAGAISACKWSAYRIQLPNIEVEIAGLHPRVCGRFGSEYETDLLVENADCAKYDALVLPGGFRDMGYDEIYSEDVYRIIREMHGSGKPIATMCVGVLPVAKAGVLEGARATTYPFSRHDNFAILESCGCEGVREPVVESNGVISCSGPAYSEQVMEILLERLVGHAATQEIEKYRAGLA